MNINIDKNETLRYLGYAGQVIDDNTQNLIDKAIKLVQEKMRPKYLYKKYDILEISDKVYLENNIQLEGDDIKNHLKNAKYVFLFCSTLSSDIDKLIDFTQLENPAFSMIINAAANTAIEEVSDIAEKEILNLIKPDYLYFRYSPGYGDLPLSFQKTLLSELNAQKLAGIYLNSSYIMQPKKSITAIIGVSDIKPLKKKSSCISCNMAKNCEYRKKGVHCGF